ncbi:MAG: hypothetical protein J6M06_04575 [Synergistaceae bacterium]|nr:hypothetical protein [Synergistaceae bacterium]
MGVDVEFFNIYGKMQNSDKDSLVKYLKENLKEPDSINFDDCSEGWFDVSITDNYDSVVNDLTKNIIEFLAQNNLNVVLRSDFDSYYESARAYGLVTRNGETIVDVDSFVSSKQDELQKQLENVSGMKPNL